MESAFRHVVEPADRVIVVVNGFFAAWMVETDSGC